MSKSDGTDILDIRTTLDLQPDGESISKQCQQALISWFKRVSVKNCNCRVIEDLDQADEKSDIWRVAGRTWRLEKRELIRYVQDNPRRLLGAHPKSICDQCNVRSTDPQARAWKSLTCQGCDGDVCTDCAIPDDISGFWCHLCSMDHEEMWIPKCCLTLHHYGKTKKREESNGKIWKGELLWVIKELEDVVLGLGPRALRKRAMMTAILDMWQTVARGGTYVIFADVQDDTAVDSIILLHNMAGESIEKLKCLKLQGLFSCNKLQRNLVELHEVIATLRRQGRLSTRGKLSLQLGAALENILRENDYCITSVTDWRSNASSSTSSSARRPNRKIMNQKLDKP